MISTSNHSLYKKVWTCERDSMIYISYIKTLVLLLKSFSWEPDITLLRKTSHTIEQISYQVKYHHHNHEVVGSSLVYDFHDFFWAWH